MFPWLQQTFVGEFDCVTSPKNAGVRRRIPLKEKVTPKSFLFRLQHLTFSAYHLCASLGPCSRSIISERIMADEA